jgi:hypothetical protein
MQKIFSKIILFSVILSGLFVLSYFAKAQSLLLTSDKPTYQVGEDVLINLNLDTSDKIINAIEGTVNFSTEYFDIQSIKTGDSFLTLWPSRPIASDSGNISFAGGIPHGFKGANGNIFSFILKPKKIGNSTVSISNAKVLLNDGLGTELKNVEFAPLNIKIVSSDGNSTETSKEATDKTSPLPFTPVVSRNYSIAQNKYFVSFSTVDKESGVSYYKVKEDYVLLPYFYAIYSVGWQKAETPYVLKLQNWWSKIYVRAYDGAGNFREEVVNKPLDKEGIVILDILLAILAIITIIILFFIIFIKYGKKKKII